MDKPKANGRITTMLIDFFYEGEHRFDNELLNDLTAKSRALYSEKEIEERIKRTKEKIEQGMKEGKYQKRGTRRKMIKVASRKAAATKSFIKMEILRMIKIGYLRKQEGILTRNTKFRA